MSLRDRYALLRHIPMEVLRREGLDGDQLRMTLRFTCGQEGAVIVQSQPHNVRLDVAHLRGVIPPGHSYQLVITEQQIVSMARNGQDRIVPDEPLCHILGMSLHLRSLVKGLREHLGEFQELQYQQVWDVVIQTIGAVCIQDPRLIARFRSGRPYQFRTVCMCCFNAAGRDRDTFQWKLMQTLGMRGRTLGEGDLIHAMWHIGHTDPWYSLFTRLFEALNNAILNDVRSNGVVHAMLDQIERGQIPN